MLHLDEGVAYSVEGGAILRGHVRGQTIIASERVDLLREWAGTTSVCVFVIWEVVTIMQILTM